MPTFSVLPALARRFWDMLVASPFVNTAMQAAATSRRSPGRKDKPCADGLQKETSALQPAFNFCGEAWHWHAGGKV